MTHSEWSPEAYESPAETEERETAGFPDTSDGPVTINGVTYGWEPDEWDVINANEADDYRNDHEDY